MSYSDLSELSGLDIEKIKDIEVGHKNINIGDYEKIMKILNVKFEVK